MYYGPTPHWMMVEPDDHAHQVQQAREQATREARRDLLHSFDEYVEGASAGFGQTVGVAFQEELAEHDARLATLQGVITRKEVNVQVLEAQIECLREDRDELARANERDRKVHLRRRKREHATTVSVTSLLTAASAMVVILAVLFAV